jgi:dienelactone hydrolase
MRLISVFVLFCIFASAQDNSAVYFSVPAADAPELARRGPYAVGVRTLDIVHPGQVDILNFNKDSGQAPLYDRPLKLEVWYPAIIPEGKTEHTVYESSVPRPERMQAEMSKSFQIAGKALRDAAPEKAGPFPLVVVSHGYPGARTFLTYLTENLASKGYVVAAIDHTDSVFGQIKPFQSTLLNRANDQLFTIDALEERSRKQDDFLYGLIDSSRTAIIGYSMGGYGALASAGAGYSTKGAVGKFVPGGYFEEWTAGNPKYEARLHKNLKAIVAIAPWGAQPPFSSWEDEAFAGIRIPSLFIVGDHDDVAGYEQGAKKVYENAVNSERCMLVYENALHNVGGNPLPPGVAWDFTARESFEEPVWRKDRITAINQHFVTAFLDLYLKGDESRRSYLHVPVVKSSDGKWPLPQGQNARGRFSKGADEGLTYWKGFQRRWAAGLEMYCAGAPKK